MSLDAGKDRSVPDGSNATFASLRRAKSLDRRVTESSMTVSTGGVITIHVCYFWNVHDVMHHSLMSSNKQYYHTFVPLYWSFLKDFSLCCWGWSTQSVVGLLAKLQLPANPTRSGSQTHGHAHTSAAAATDDYK